MSAPTPQRITQALDMAGMYGPQVDAALGVAEPTVDLWETGDIVPTATQVRRLALLTGFPERFFYGPPAPEPDNGWICGSDGCRPLGEKRSTCGHCGGSGFGGVQ